ncbi:S8 family peptidase [Microbulbifer celer]|uniref:Carbohydrate-binding protein n=1 Tax=Microbulbifer celer TaxID=435905 RepID=A0ABW3U7V7_9GAMM|nr:S8 family serine peptidase [Microbulbifer celer]UFN56600.1 S8 family serine peptidase [Microbulbifer celer]
MRKEYLKMTALSVGLFSAGAWAADGQLVVRFKEVAHPYVELSYAQRAGELRGKGKFKARFPLGARRASLTSRGIDRGSAYRRFRLDRYFEMPVPAGADQAQIDNLVSTLAGNADVEKVYFEPAPEPAAIAEPAAVPDFTHRQGYLYSREGNPEDSYVLGGVDAHHAWTLPGGDGSGVDVVTTEIGAFNNNHVDLPQPFMVVGDYVIDGHDTASAGIIASLDNGFGTTGIAHGARLGYAKYGVDRMIQAAEQLPPGSVMQVGIHYLHNSLDQHIGCGSSCYMPLDYYDGPYDAVRYITQELGVHVVAAAGNGNINLDHSYFNGRFDPNQRDSGSLLVGAADPATGLRASFSNYGKRVGTFSWGWNVTTTGYGGLYNETNAKYTATFSGTSSANPIVAGAVASLQGIASAAGLGALDTGDMRELVNLTGYPMQNGDDTTIGTHPDLRAAAELLLGNTGGTNRAPLVSVPTGTVVSEGESFELAANASDPDGDTLTFQWQAPGMTLVEGSGSTASLIAPQVDGDTAFTVAVAVSDGTDTTHAEVAVTVEDAAGGGCDIADPEAINYPAWDIGAIYTAGDQVSHSQLVWQANHWTQGNEPSFTAAQWTLVSEAEVPWSADATYSGGDEVNHEGRRYRAQWWSRGDESGTASVWVDIGPSSCL